VAYSVHTSPLFPQCPNCPNLALDNRVSRTADTVILLAKLDVSNHNGAYVSIAGHNIPVLEILGHV